MHDEKINKDTEKEIVDFLKKNDLYNYKEPEEVKTANKEAEKRVEEFRSGEIKTLLEKYKQCNNVKKLVVKEKITDIEKFKDRNLIGANFLISCKDKQEQPKFFIFEEKKENNQKIDDKEKDDNIEIEIVNDKKIKVTKGDENALDLKKQKYALFKIKTTKGETVYLYCSDVESSSNDRGIFRDMDHTSISVIACDTKKVTNMASMFYYCRSLTELDIKNFNTTNVTNMENMFYYCEKIENLDISNFDVKKVNNIGSMFENCLNLKTLNFKHFDDLAIETKCNHLFYDCEILTKIEMDDFDMVRHFAKEEENEIFVLCESLIDECKKKLWKEYEITSINIVDMLKKQAEEEKQKMKDEEENKIKEKEQEMRKEVENNIKAYENIRKQKEKINKKVVRSNSFTCKKIESSAGSDHSC